MKLAVLVIDVQHALCTGEYAVFEAGNLIGRINDVLEKARAAATLVIFIQHESPDGILDYGSDGWRLADGLKVLPSDLVVRKTASDAFHETELQAVLQERGIGELVICGLQSEFCVDTTIRRALSLGYPVTLVADGHATMDNDVLTATQIARHHNVTLANITSFGARVALSDARDLRFGASTASGQAP